MARKINNRSLNERQSRFVDEYLKDLNATQAYIRSGYAKEGAAPSAAKLLTNTKIAEEVSRRRKIQGSQLSISAERIMNEIAKVAFGSLGDIITIHADGSASFNLADATPDHIAALSSYQVEEFMDGGGDDARPVRRMKITQHDKLKALELAGRHLGMWNDKIKLDVDTLLVDRLLEGRKRARGGNA
jgi:phage terminase small subunit